MKLQIVHTKSIEHLIAVSDRVYYITNKAYDDDHVLTLLNPCEDTVSLTYLQVFQLFAYRISKELRSIPKHPLFEELKKSLLQNKKHSNMKIIVLCYFLVIFLIKV